MSGEYRGRDCKANIVIVPTTSSYELELEPQRERTHRKRGSWLPLTWSVCRALHRLMYHRLHAVGGVRIHLQHMLVILAGSSQPARKPATREVNSSPKNYLMSGGYRAANRDRDEQLLQLNRAAMKARASACSVTLNRT